MSNGDLPKRHDLVICRVTKIDPHSASVEVIEYKKVGLIHASEVAKRWVRDIREFLKEGQYIVCKVMDVDRRTNTVILSAKRLSREESDRKLNEFKRERKSEKMLEQIAKTLGKTLEQAYNEVGFTLQNEFGSLTKTFEMVEKNPELFKKRELPEKWKAEIMAFVEKSLSEKVHDLKINLRLISYKEDGVEIIKKVLSGVKGYEVKYISAPNYTMSGTGKNYKELKAKMTVEAENVVKEMSKNGGEASFQVMEK